MACPGARICLLFCLLAVAGCASYRPVDLPWQERPQAGEFATRSDMRVGDRVRVTEVGGEVVEGLLVEWDRLAVTVADTAGGPRLFNVPTDDVVLIEVWDREPGRKLATAGLVVASTALAILVVQELFEEDDQNIDWLPAGAAR
jgi:hypothetical protein